ncbi:hypothetical protein [Clostridium sp. D33t1_170424_F3]|uniref:hypothetical protein n=1 Tax=Clostridium sp. D33t1_170424_F3 TaxID=2787099 RepID=UPI0018A8B898|nr:hypothetical protein [Clostridium sp. D33t1_170424_F3]
MRKKHGVFFMIVGALLIVSALGLAMKSSYSGIANTEGTTALEVSSMYLEEIPGKVASGKMVDIPDSPVPKDRLPREEWYWPIPVITVMGLTLFSTGWFCSFKGRER